METEKVAEGFVEKVIKRMWTNCAWNSVLPVKWIPNLIEFNGTNRGWKQGGETVQEMLQEHGLWSSSLVVLSWDSSALRQVQVQFGSVVLLNPPVVSGPSGKEGRLSRAQFYSCLSSRAGLSWAQLRGSAVELVWVIPQSWALLPQKLFWSGFFSERRLMNWKR